MNIIDSRNLRSPEVVGLTPGFLHLLFPTGVKVPSGIFVRPIILIEWRKQSPLLQPVILDHERDDVPIRYFQLRVIHFVSSVIGFRFEVATEETTNQTILY